MIATLTGTLQSKTPEAVVVDVRGVGYEVRVPISTLADLPSVGESVMLYIHTHVREDAIQLFGFRNPGEKRVFITLLGISGIGPKVALNILSGIAYEDFLNAVESEEISILTKIPGLGKKTAHRIILELRGKLPREVEPAGGSVHNDALSALMNLGYKRADATDAIELARKSGVSELESILREALKSLTGD
jgi:Holliday junction DNA helicase RuvA